MPVVDTGASAARLAAQRSCRAFRKRGSLAMRVNQCREFVSWFCEPWPRIHQPVGSVIVVEPPPGLAPALRSKSQIGPMKNLSDEVGSTLFV